MLFISLRLTESPNKASALTYIVFLLPDKRCYLTARISFKTKIYFLQSLYSCFHLFLFPFQIQPNTGQSEDARVWWPALSSSSMCLAIELTDKDSYDLIWYLTLTLVCDTGQSPHLENGNTMLSILEMSLLALKQLYLTIQLTKTPCSCFLTEENLFL